MTAKSAALCLAASLIAVPASASIIASSTFDTNAEGWTEINDGNGITYLGSGGNPGGFIQSTDQGAGSTWYFSAPGTFLGNISSAYSGLLEFDVKVSTISNPFSDSDVVLKGANGTLTLVYDASPNPNTTSWTAFDISLNEAGWKVGTLAGPAATSTQMQAVLSDLESLYIRGEFHNGGGDTGMLDNVVLTTPVPEPGSLLLLGSGALAIVRARRRRLE